MCFYSGEFEVIPTERKFLWGGRLIQEMLSRCPLSLLGQGMPPGGDQVVTLFPSTHFWLFTKIKVFVIIIFTALEQSEVKDSPLFTQDHILSEFHK